MCCCSLAKLCLALYDLMGGSSSVLHCLPEFAQTHVHLVGGAVYISSSAVLLSFCPQSFPASGSFPMSWLCTSGGQSIEASASALVLPMDIRVDFL